MKRVLLILLVFATLASCATMTRMLVRVDVDKLRVGQTESEVRQFCQRPDAVNTTVVDGQTVKQWVYRNAAGMGQRNVYLYFHNGRLRSWQY